MKYTALLILSCAVLAPRIADANGRRPTMVDVHFHPTDDDWILGAATFGFLFSRDGGATFHWVCEDAACPGEEINGCDTFDPVFAIATDGTIFNTTIFGLHVSRDNGCSFNPVGGPLAGRFSSDVDLASDGTVWTMTSDGAQPNDIYRSIDNGASFQTRNLHLDTGWFDSMRVAPTDPQRIYVSGFAPAELNPDGGLGDPTTLAWRSEDGGASWQPLTLTGVPTGVKLGIELVSPTDADTLFARVAAVPDFGMETLFRSTDRGDSWTAVLTLTAEVPNSSDPPGMIRIAARADGQTYLAGSALGGLHISTDGGANWSSAPVSPRTWCVAEHPDGTLFACSENWDNEMQLDPSVRAALLTSTDDAATWQHLLRFDQIAGPLDCPAGTAQHDVCAAERWCTLIPRLELEDPVRCPAAADAGPGGDAGTQPPPDDDCGNCGCSVAFASVIFVLPPGRRRRRRRGWSTRRRRAADRVARTRAGGDGSA